MVQRVRDETAPLPRKRDATLASMASGASSALKRTPASDQDREADAPVD
jgi:hypothetical protein